MKITQIFFLCCFIGFTLVFANGAETIPDDELSILLSIKSSLVDPQNFLKDWKVPKEGESNKLQHCNWTGVWCNSGGFIEKLDLSNMNLSGRVSDDIQRLRSLSSLNLCCNGFTSSLPKSLANLTALKSVDLSENNFNGNFPTGLGKARGLTLVNASSNDFSGFLPEDLGNATSLETMDFRGSFFEGAIPTSFRELKKLRFLGLSGNNLTGKIPGELGELYSLETMILGYNDFEGEIPSEFGNLTNLEYLDLAVGSLTGQIPPTLGKLKKLTVVYLYKNSFTGTIPLEFGNMTLLELLDLSDNQISGEIPVELAELENLQLLSLMCNNLRGNIPQKFGESPKLAVFELWKNMLTGSLPAKLGQKSPLVWLDVSSNLLTGEIPPGLCDFGNLTKLILFNNSFTGTFPRSISACKSLVRVRIQNNGISGEIPIGFGNLPVLQRLELAHNNLTGKIPGDISQSTSLSFIDVSFNQLESSLPPTILSIPNMQNFIASHNNLDGKLPSRFQDFPTLSVLDLSFNQFSGEIPENIGSCQRLVTLNLKNNQLIGEIPKAVATMPTLSILDLSNNSLTGRIPDNLGTSPALETLNLSYNELDGPVPLNGILTNINTNELAGNSGLCGGALPPCTEKSVERKTQPRKSHINHIIVGFIIGTLVILSLWVIILSGKWVYKRWYTCNSFFYDFFNKTSKEWPWRLVAFQRLNFTSTDVLACIKESNIIGMGATGIVYKAEIHQPHNAVAVKKLWKSGSDIESGEDLFGEVSLLGGLRHRNIVRLLGYLHNETDVMMVSEYMPNGNLSEALYGKEADRLLVDWVSRYNIAVGIAHGLNYLHHDCEPPVIHRDIKSNNILLDANLEARIADFGLARMMLRKNETVSMVAGSYGYIAPEYGYTLKVDEKSDIYSYGVVLLELLTGKKPVDSTFGENIDIVEWVLRKRKNKALEEALDSSIAGPCKHVREEMLLVLRIALLCTAKLPKDRPSMRDVITMLGEAKPRRKSICLEEERSTNREKNIFSNSPVIGLL